MVNEYFDAPQANWLLVIHNVYNHTDTYLAADSEHALLQQYSAWLDAMYRRGYDQLADETRMGEVVLWHAAWCVELHLRMEQVRCTQLTTYAN